MTDRLPDNLSFLHSRFGSDAIEAILPGDSFSVDGVEFVCKYVPGSTSKQFYIVKNLELVERYRELCEENLGGTIVELGIAEGGSTALLALLAHPTRLVAIDLEPERLKALDDFIDERSLQEVVRPLYGVDQADRERLRQLVEDELRGAPLDLVIDDCSHQFRPTRASFETLFPLLRPGGRYVIEDWNADHVMYDAVRKDLANTAAQNRGELLAEIQHQLRDQARTGAVKRDPLTRLAIELVVARSSLTDVIAEVSVDEFWISIRRGPGEIDASSFRLNDHYLDHFGFVPPSRDGEG